MFGRHFTLFNLLGIEVKADYSWIFLALLVTWSLAASAFPYYVEGLSPLAYWVMGVAGAAGLFGSLIFHEYCHALVARRYGVTIRGITLFIFGGVAEMESDPRTPQVEFLMAAAGPAGSFFLAGAFYMLSTLTGADGALVTITAVLGYLALINAVLAGFNLVPGFPLDGGRVLRAIVWYITGNMQRATEVAAMAGGIFGFVLIAMGIVSFIGGDFVSGIWWALLGLFLRAAAGSSVTQLAIKGAFEGAPVARFMTPDPIAVDPRVTVAEFVENFVYRYYHEMFPVTDGDRLIGCVTVQDVKRIPSDRWAAVRVADIARPIDAGNAVDADTDILQLVAEIQRRGNSRYLVLRDGRLVGIIVMKDIMKMFAMRLDLSR